MAPQNLMEDKMKVRHLIICNKDGVKSDPMLQYWCTFLKRWVDVEVVECKEENIVDALNCEHYS